MISGCEGMSLRIPNDLNFAAGGPVASRAKKIQESVSMKTICYRFLASMLIGSVSCIAFADDWSARDAAAGAQIRAAIALQQAKENPRVLASSAKRGSVRDYVEDSAVMHLGQVSVFQVGVVDRVAIGNGKVASATVLDKNRLLVIAQDVGETNILLWDKTRPVGNLKLRVTAVDLERQKKEIAAMLSDVPNLTVGNAGDRIFVDGVDLSPEQQARVKSVKDQFPTLMDRTRGILQPEKPASPSTMVMFDLYFLEFKKNHLQDLGVSWTKSFNGINFGAFGETTRGPLNLRPGIGGTGGVTYDPKLPNTKINGLSTAFNVSMSVPGIINLAVNTGQATLLAAPKLAVRSGGVAKFLAGGEFPIAIAGITGNTVVYKQYGIILEVEPKVNSDKTVSGVIRAEVSALDPTVTVNNYPGMTKRRTETDFHSPMGEAIVLSGLYSQELSQATDKVPLLGDIPVLNAFFSSKSDTRKNSELVVFIVPNAHSSEEAMNQEVISRAAEMNTGYTAEVVEGDVIPKLTIESKLWHGMDQRLSRVPQPEAGAAETNGGER